MQGNLGVAAGFWVLDVVGLLEGEVEEEGVGG